MTFQSFAALILDSNLETNFLKWAPDPPSELSKFLISKKKKKKTVNKVRQKVSMAKDQRGKVSGCHGWETVCQKNGQSPWQAAGHRLAEPMGRKLLGGKARRQDPRLLRNAEDLTTAVSRETA